MSYQNLVIILLIFILLLNIYQVYKNIYIPYPYDYEDAVKKLSRQALRYSLASTQDENIIIRVLHANYGAGYLFALQEISKPDDIKKILGINPIEMNDFIINNQDKATAELSSKLSIKKLPESEITKKFIFLAGQ